MKSNALTLRCIVLLCALAATLTPTLAAQEVTIPDPGLESALRYKLGLGPTDPITETALAGITYFYAGDYGIIDLTGLEYCTSLTELHLWDNQISDLTPLQGLTSLTELDLWDSQISDLTPLQGLTSLTELYLEYNQISDLTPLQGLTSLTGLMLSHNCISDLFPLLGLDALDSVNVNYNPLSDTAITEQIPQFSDNGVFVNFTTYSEDNCPVSEGENEGEGEPVEGEGPVVLPADLNADWRIVMSEAIAYLSGWQQGCNPMNYAIRAAYLWKNGEGYAYDAGQAPPLCWILAP
ncbi:MAG: Internalin-A precursor [Candidatus Hydrogenedentes bacterium ADurb.Bin179]|nr:MAG: Internalin-A precursor [Candidatus Hydrogenedentes bacterium ADurb.Bin179]